VLLKKLQNNIHRLPFISQCRQLILNRFGKPIKNTNGEYEYEVRPHIESSPNLEFLTTYSITPDSHPADWYDVFIPPNRKRQGSEGLIIISDITSFTNKKAYLFNAGRGGTQYPKFTPFSVDETMRHIGLYMLNGLCFSPQVETKFDSQERNQTNSNDMCNRVFGTYARRRHKEFKAFLAIQDPVKPVPPRKTHPNWKVQPLPKHAVMVSKAAIVLGKGLALDEETIVCKGRHPDILRITYKKEGGGFQCDALCSDGYTFSFYFHNQPAPKRFIDKGMSSLH